MSIAEQEELLPTQKIAVCVCQLAWWLPSKYCVMGCICCREFSLFFSRFVGSNPFEERSQVKQHATNNWSKCSSFYNTFQSITLWPSWISDNKKHIFFLHVCTPIRCSVDTAFFDILEHFHRPNSSALQVRGGAHFQLSFPLKVSCEMPSWKFDNDERNRVTSSVILFLIVNIGAMAVLSI